MSPSSSAFIVLIITAYLAKDASALECINCNWTISSGDPGCFNYTDTYSAPSTECTYNQSDNPYCSTEMTLLDGIVTRISRSCKSGLNDHDTSVPYKPKELECVSTSLMPGLGSETVDEVLCYFSCNFSYVNCNTDSPESLKVCDLDCGSHGRCDYVTGACACDEGWSGNNCSTDEETPPSAEKPYISCVQCDTETYPDCLNLVRADQCPTSDYQYCAISQTTTYDETGNKKRDFISKTCALKFLAADECFITESASSTADLEYTCVSTCDQSGCNAVIKAPNGVLDNGDPKNPLQCVVCDSKYDPTCANSVQQTTCSSTDTYCTSKVTYYISDKEDLGRTVDPEYQLDRVIRGCASDALPGQCSTSALQSSSMKRVTCQESCQSDGCNTGWPARPTCSQCSCLQCTADDECNSRPPPPTSCSMPYHQYCTMIDVERPIITALYQNGYPRTISRGCSYSSIGNTCSFSKYSIDLENCNTTCSTDGCNLGYSPYSLVAAGSSTILPSALCVVLSALCGLTAMLTSY